MYRNIMELLVEQRLQELARHQSVCTCQECHDDIMAHALNHLPVKYVSSAKGELFSRAQNFSAQHDFEIVRALALAVKIVSEKPRHFTVTEASAPVTEPEPLVKPWTAPPSEPREAFGSELVAQEPSGAGAQEPAETPRKAREFAPPLSLADLEDAPETSESSESSETLEMPDVSELSSEAAAQAAFDFRALVAAREAEESAEQDALRPKWK